MGAKLHQPTAEEIRVTQNLNELAGLLADHSPDRLAIFWEGAMGTRGASKPTTISGQLRTAIKASGRTAYAIGQQAGVDPGVITIHAG